MDPRGNVRAPKSSPKTASLPPKGRLPDHKTDIQTDLIVVLGSPASEKGRYDNEGPQHKVMIARPRLASAPE
jgi:hypothetical protein